ncbi:hypothetical protein JCM10908_005369 [Rhodotorula pacifica]|uniref:SRPBCC family protein n=1 Tax=Rhodotorula pacifica TaxID=1495444 RepID=UPI0031741D41
MAVSSVLTLHELARKDLPSSPDDPAYATWVDSAVSASLQLINSLSSAALDPVWSKGKVHNGAQTYTIHSATKPPPGAGETDGFKWHARKSTHDASSDLSFEQFERGLLRDHSLNEAKYIESCTDAKRLEVIKAGELEASNRDFAITILTVPVPAGSTPSLTRGRAFLIISIPYAHPSAQGYTRGKYVSVEHVAEVPETGKIEWTMAVSSDPGGLVPKVISEMSMPSKISEDVPSFVKWAKKEFA